VRVVVSGLGLVTPLADQPSALREAAAAGRTVVAPQEELEALPWSGAGVVGRPDLRPWLLRRKDRKLLSRAAQLALPAAGTALGAWAGDREELGLFVGVGREPPDTGASEPSLAASSSGGRLDPEALSTRGRELYPPLLPLLTLPNLVLSHVSINLGIHGCNGTVAGECAAGLGALVEATWAVAEGRCPAALAGGADSRVDFGSARDLYRLGRAGRERPPGEGAVFLLLEREDRAEGALAYVEPVSRGPSTATTPAEHWPLCGDLGAADGLLRLVLRILAGAWGILEVSDDEGSTIAVRVSPPSARP
jgi:hypothetical protein